MSKVVDIPGGKATLRERHEVTTEGQRAIQVLTFSLVQHRARRKPGEDMSEDELTVLIRVQEAGVYARLQSWTLPDPMPQSAADVARMSFIVCEALKAECRALDEEETRIDSDGDPVDSFFDVEDPTMGSPTGASVGSRKPATVVARRAAPSDRKKPSGTRSTGTGKRSPA